MEPPPSTSGNCFFKRDKVASASLFEGLDASWIENDEAPAAFALASDGLAFTEAVVFAEASVLGFVGGNGAASGLPFDMIVSSGLTDTDEARFGAAIIDPSAAGLGRSGRGTLAATICIGGPTGATAAGRGAGTLAATVGIVGVAGVTVAGGGGGLVVTTTGWSGLADAPAVPSAGWDGV